MHKMYQSVWKCAECIGEKIPFSNKSWFLFLNTCLWIVIGLVVTGIIILVVSGLKNNFHKMLWEIVGAGYVAVIAGFGGGIMYILRNTTPEDIK